MEKNLKQSKREELNLEITTEMLEKNPKSVLLALCGNEPNLTTASRGGEHVMLPSTILGGMLESLKCLHLIESYNFQSIQHSNNGRRLQFIMTPSQKVALRSLLEQVEKK